MMDVWIAVLSALLAVIGFVIIGLITVYVRAQKERHEDRQSNFNLQMKNLSDVFREKTDNLIVIQEMHGEQIFENRNKIEKHSEQLAQHETRIHKLEP